MVGISFKISKSGTRYVPKLSSNVKLQKHEAATDENGVHSNGINRQEVPSNLKRPFSDGVDGLYSPAKKSRAEVALRSSTGDLRTRYIDPLGCNVPKDAEASFAINLFPDGFSIDKPTEKGRLPPPALEVTDLHLLPYDRNTGDFLRAIDGGWVPSTLLEDIPCKYIDGCVVCELRDYRDSLQPPIGEALQALPRNGRDGDWMPTVQRVLLQRNSGNIIKDLKSMDLDGWTYQECLELEARLINTVQPPLCLDPTPDVAKEAYITNYNKLKYNIGCPIYGRYRKTSGSLRERRLHIAAASKALSRADGLAKRRRSSIDGGLAGGLALNELVPGVHQAGLLSPGGRHKIQDPSKISQATPGVYIQQPSASQGSLGQQTSMARAGGLTHTMSGLSVPSGPMSPSLSTPATPATSAGGYEVTSGLGGASSMLGRRESKESTAAARAEAKQIKAKQALQEKEKLQQRKLQEKQDAKEQKEKLRKEKMQQQQQLKIEKQQLSRSNSHLSLLSQQSGSISMGDGSTTPRSENRSSMGDQRDGADVVIKMEPQEVARPKQEFDTQSFEDVVKGRQEQQLGDARKQQGLQSGQQMQHMGMAQQPLLSQTSLPTSAMTFSSGVGVQDLRMMGTNHSLGTPVGTMAQAQAQAHALASNLVPAIPSHMDQMQHSLAQSRQRQNSLPKATTSTTQNPGVNGSFLVPGSGALPTSSVKVEPTTGGQRVTSNGGSEDQEQNKELERIHKLVAAIQRHGLHNRKKPVESISNVTNKPPPSFHLLSVALSETGDEIKEPMGQRSMANSLVGGNINSRKTRSLLFVKTEQKPDQAYQGGMNFQPAFHRSRKRLVLCGRAKDSLVEAIIQVGDDQEEEAVPPHHVLPTMSNVHVADRFAKQYCALLKKENYELVSDEVQQSAPRNPVVNAASSARPMPAGASTLGNPQVGHLATTQRAGMNPQLMQGSIPGNVISTHNPMQPSSPSQLAANRMPPPSNAPSRQIMNTHIGQQAVTSNVKPTQIDSAQASQLAAQQQQHHQLQQQAQMQRQPQQQHQQHQMAASQLAQLTGQGQNSVAPQLVAQSNQLQQLQFMHQQQQHQQQQQQARQHQQHHQLLNQRKLMLPGNMGNPLTSMNNMNGVGMPANAGGQANLANMVNLGGMNNVGMGGMSPMTSMSGMSSIGGMSSLANMGQLSAMNAMGQQGNLLRPGTMNQQAAALQASKAQQLAAAGRGRAGTGVLPNTAGGVRTPVDALSALQGANQVHGGAGVSVMGQGMNRGNNLGPLQRAPVTGLASPKVPSANQNYYLNSSQLNAQQQQLKSQGAQQLNSQQQQQQQQHQQQLLTSQQQQQQQLLSSQQLNPQQLNTQQLNPQQLNSQQLNPQQLNSQQLNPQQLNTQQLNPQQMNSQQLNPQQQQQLSGGGSLNSLVGNPASPQLSSGQSLNAVGNMGVSSSAAAAAARAPALQSRRPNMPQPGQPPQTGQPTQSQ